MSDISKRELLRKMIGGALGSVALASLIEEAVVAQEGRDLTLRTKDGRQIRLRLSGDRRSSTRAEIVKDGKVADRKPTGTFTLSTGKRLTLKEGVVVGGDDVESDRAFMTFALKPADRAPRTP